MTRRSGSDRDLEVLLARSGRVRALARGLCADTSAQEDLSQDALLVALQQPGAEAAPLSWFRRVLERLALDRARSDGARRAREQRVARGEAQPSTLDMLARADLQRRLVEEVLALGEPYRATLLERWFEERTPDEIAQRLGVPASTVRTRLARGQALLRERLERREGTGWLSALAALGHGRVEAPATTTSLATGGLLVATGTKLAGIGVALALGVLWFMQPWSAPAPSASARADAAESELELQPVREQAVELDHLTRSEIAAAQDAKPAAEVVTALAEITEAEVEELEAQDGVFEGLKLRGLVLRGREPLPSGTAWLAPGNRIAPSDPRQTWVGVLNPVPRPDNEPRSTPIGPDGRFEFEFSQAACYTLAIDDGSGVVRQHVFSALLRGRYSATVVIVLGSATLGGRVFDEHGAPCVGARVVVDQHLTRNHKSRDFAAIASTDEQGAYLVRHLPAGSFRVGVLRDPDPRSVLVDETVELKLEVGQQATHDFGRARALPVWSGTLRSRSGEPVSGVIVRLTETHRSWQRSVAVVGGRFEFALAPGTYRASTEQISLYREFVDLALVKVGESGLERDLELPGARLRGLLLDASTNAPPVALCEQFISIRPRGHDHPGAFTDVLLAPDGTFVVDGLWPGDWVIGGHPHRVQAVGGGEASINIRAGDITAPLTVQIAPR